MAAKIVAVGQFDTRPLTSGKLSLAARAGQEKQGDFIWFYRKHRNERPMYQTVCANEADTQGG